MSEEFVVRRVKRRRLKGKPSSISYSTVTPTPTHTPIPTTVVSVNDEQDNHQDEMLPQYLLDPPDTPDGVILKGNHTKELVCSYRVAKEVLGSSFRPKESNLAVGKIRV